MNKVEKKAEQRAGVYARSHQKLGYDYYHTFDAVKYGYLQADKDLALTVEDMKTLDDIFLRVSNEMSIGDVDNRIAIEDYYKEVLRRFNEYKNK